MIPDAYPYDSAKSLDLVCTNSSNKNIKNDLYERLIRLALFCKYFCIQVSSRAQVDDAANFAMDVDNLVADCSFHDYKMGALLNKKI